MNQEQRKWRVRWIEFDGDTDFDERLTIRAVAGHEFKPEFPSSEVIKFVEAGALLECQKDEQLLLAANKLLADENMELQRQLQEARDQMARLADACKKVMDLPVRTTLLSGKPYLDQSEDEFFAIKKVSGALASYQAYLQRNEKQRGDG